MLTTLRNSSKNTILKVFLGSLLTILIISFAMWGTEDLVGVTKKQSTVATVGSIDISSREFYSLYSRQTEEIRKLLGSSLSIEKARQFGYVDRALGSLINRALFNNEAVELGLSVSDINDRDKILKDESFKDDLGQFSELLFRQLISESGYTEDSYIDGTRQDLAREQMIETVRSSLTIPEVIMKSLGEYDLQERSVDYVVIDAKKEKIKDPDDNQIRSFFNENKEDFFSEEFRSAKTLLLDAKKYAEKLTVTEDEIEILYEERKQALIDPEERYILQILVDEKKKAEKIYKLLKSGEKFENVAKKEVDLTEEDIDLGWNTRNELPEEIVNSVFSLNLNEISKPLKSTFGWHIMKMSKKKDRRETTYQEVKEKFRNEILLEKGKEAVFDLQDELEDLLASGNTFEEISKTLDVKLIIAKDINRQGIKIDGQKNNEFNDERILRSVFTQKINEEGNIIDIDKDEGLAISIVTKVTKPRQMNFDEAKDLAKEKLLKKNQLSSAIKKAKKIKNELDKGQKINQIAKNYMLETKGVKPFTRILPDSSELPIPLISKIFDSKLGDVNIHQRGENEVILAQTAEILNNLYNDKSEIKDLTEKIKDDLSIDLLAQFSEALRKKYKITINDDVIDQLN